VAKNRSSVWLSVCLPSSIVDTLSEYILRVATHVENLEKSGNSTMEGKVRKNEEIQGKVRKTEISVIVQCNYH